ncbi:MAG: hypothetical protein WCE81_08340 [Halobacteriota archaeon]
MFMCDKYKMDAYKARGITPHYDALCNDDCTLNSSTGGHCEHLYLLIQNEFDRTYSNLGIPVVEGPTAVLKTEVQNISERINMIGVDRIMDCAFEISLILSEITQDGHLNIPNDVLNDIAYSVVLGLFLDNPEEVVDRKMLRALSLIKEMAPDSFNRYYPGYPNEDF